MASLKPMHPYDIMLCRVSKHMGNDKEVMHRLGRIMGFRRTSQIECPSLLFQRLEEEELLSEFKVTDFRNALNFLDLGKAADMVREYEENYLAGESKGDQPPPYPGESQDTIDVVTSSDDVCSQKNMEPQDDFIKPLRDPEPMTDNAEEENQTEDETSVTDLYPKSSKIVRSKYHTVNLSTMKQDYPDMLTNNKVLFD